jgi:hypothetical protein
VLLDASLVVSLRSAARVRGMTIAALVERALEVELDGYVDAGPGSAGSVAGEGAGVREVGGRDRVDGPVSPDAGRLAPDWGAILAAGRDARVPVRDTVSQVPADWTMEIA